mgnify:CR=1 FL=1
MIRLRTATGVAHAAALCQNGLRWRLSSLRRILRYFPLAELLYYTLTPPHTVQPQRASGSGMMGRLKRHTQLPRACWSADAAGCADDQSSSELHVTPALTRDARARKEAIARTSTANPAPTISTDARS